MNLIARTILYYRCNHTRILLRLFKRTHYTTWTFQKFREEYRYFLPRCTYQTNANPKSQTHDISNIPIYEPEHKKIHSILANSIHYKDSIVLPINRIQQVTNEELNNIYATDWSCQDEKQTFKAIKQLAYCHLNGSHFDISLYNQILQSATLNLPKFNDNMIKLILPYLIVLVDEMYETTVCNKFLKELDNQCIKRFFKKSTNEMLLICDAFYQLKGYSFNYFWRANRKLCSKVHSLNAKNLVQLLFLLNYTRPNSFINMFEIECQVYEHISELSGDEIGIVARSFFLNKKRVRSRTLMSKMMNRVLQCMDTVDNVTLTSLMKLIRYSASVYCVSTFAELLTALYQRVPHMPLKSLTHVMHACATLRIYDQILIDKILERTVNEMKFLRLKDIERILHTISAITPNTKYYTDICHEFKNEIISNYQTERAIEVQMYASTFASIGMHLAIKDIYVPELIQYTFDPDFVKKMYKNNLKLLKTDFLYLHCCVKIDMPDYEGPFFNENIYQQLVKIHSFNDDIIRKDNNVKLRTEIVFVCKNNLKVNPYVDYILPHHCQRYIVLGLDESGKCIDVEPILSNMPLGTIRYVNSDELKKIKWKILFIIPLLARVRGHNSIHGNMRKNIQHLMTVGYTPILICEEEWESFTDEEKVNYLYRSIFEDSKHDLLIELFPNH